MTVQAKKKVQLIKAQVKKYCGLLGEATPKVIASEADYALWQVENRNKMAHGVDRPRIADRFGSCHRKQKLIFINADRLKDPKKLDTVIRREVLHLTRPNYYTTRPIFKDCSERLRVGNVKNGRFCKDN